MDYILTYGLDIQHIMTLPVNTPVISNHEAIGIDINIEELFNSHYSTLQHHTGCLLALNNIRAKHAHIKYVLKKHYTTN